MLPRVLLFSMLPLVPSVPGYSKVPMVLVELVVSVKHGIPKSWLRVLGERFGLLLRTGGFCLQGQQTDEHVGISSGDVFTGKAVWARCCGKRVRWVEGEQRESAESCIWLMSLGEDAVICLQLLCPLPKMHRLGFSWGWSPTGRTVQLTPLFISLNDVETSLHSIDSSLLSRSNVPSSSLVPEKVQ